MSDDLMQSEADRLLAMKKKPTKAGPVNWPALGKKATVDLLSMDEREEFVLDIERSYVKISKLTLQNRAWVTVSLARLDLDGASHRNPDDSELPCPHLHLFREGYNDKWAIPVPVEHFKNIADRRQTVSDFMAFCSIVEVPNFIKDLLS